MMMKKKLLAFLITLLSSLIFCVFILQNNAKVKHTVLTSLTTLLEKEWDATISADSCSLNLFKLSITLNNGLIKPHTYPKTFWGFNNAAISINFYTLLMKKKAQLSLVFNEVIGTTQLQNNSCELIEHLTKILTAAPSAFEVTIHDLSINNGSIILNSAGPQATLLVNGTFNLKKQKIAKDYSEWHGSVDSVNSQLLINNDPFINSITGSSLFIKKKNLPWSIASSHSFIQEQKNDPLKNSYSVTGTWNTANKIYTVDNPGTTTHLILNFNKSNDLLVSGTAAIEPCAKIYETLTQQAVPQITGDALINLTIANYSTDAVVTGDLVFDKLAHPTLPLNNITLDNFTLSSQKMQANCSTTLFHDKKIGGTVTWDNARKNGSCSLTNHTDLPFFITTKPSTGGWIIQAGEGALTINFDAQAQSIGTFHANFTHELSENTKHHAGRLILDNKQLQFIGGTTDDSYELTCSWLPTPHITKISYHSATDKDPVIFLKNNTQNNFLLEGLIKYSFLQSLMSQDIRRTLLGKSNSIALSIDQKNPALITGSIKSQGNNFCIPKIDNLVKSFSTTFALDTKNQECKFYNNAILFSKGSIECPQLLYSFKNNEANGHFFHAPIHINNVLINWKKDFYSFVYGTLLASKKPGNIAELNGSLVLKKTLIRGDFFGSLNDTQQSSSTPRKTIPTSNFPIHLAINVTNEKPILIKTPLLEAHASLDLLASYDYNAASLQSPKITGTIDLENGHLNFLENKLFIEYGKIQFMTSQPEDAIIDLIAKNRINKYTVTLQASGSIKKNSLALESTPELTEEQIVSLLLAGSENASLQNDLPIMLMQNLSTYLLGKFTTKNRTSSIMQTLSKPLKYVQISPTFADQSGHSGVKGILSVPLNKQVRAQVQKNLTLQSYDNFELDNFGFNLEYLFSDDVNLKFVRDQHGEVGSEVEVKFKF